MSRGRGRRGAQVRDLAEGRLRAARADARGAVAGRPFTRRRPRRIGARAPAAVVQQLVVPVAVIDVHRQHGDAVAPRVLDQLRGGVEAHGLAVQQADVEGRRVVALEPGGDVGQQGEARRVGLGEAVAAKALDLVEQAPRVVLAVAAAQHALGELLLEGQQLAVAPPVGDGPAQLVRLAAGEARGDHGQADHLLLEDRHAQGALQHAFDRLVGIGDASRPCRRRR
jgi:hypothetical protein